MTENADVPLSDERPIREGTAPRFYVVSSEKLFALSVFSFGFYFIYWSYKNWSLHQAVSKDDIWPWARGVFYIFFVHRIYREADQKIRSSGGSFDWDFEQWATVFVVITVVPNVLDYVVGVTGSYLYSSSLILLAIPLRAYVLAQNQKLLNFAANDPEALGNCRFTLWNYLVVVPGALIWISTLYGIWQFYR